jgi:hypothetical protein
MYASINPALAPLLTMVDTTIARTQHSRRNEGKEEDIFQLNARMSGDPIIGSKLLMCGKVTAFGLA